jgi:septum formation protein
VATGEGRGSAGGYEIEHRGAQLMLAVHGSWFNVVGLPLLPLISALRELGWRPSF